MTTLVSKRHPSKKLQPDEYIVLRTGIVNKLDRLYPYDVVADAVARYNAKPHNYGVMDGAVNTWCECLQ